MKIEFVPIDYDYFDFNGKNYIRIIGRTERGKKVCIVDSYEPNFWVILKKDARPDKVLKKLEKIKVEKASRVSEVLKTKVLDKKFLGKDVKAIQIFVTNHKDAHDIASAIGDMNGIEKRREYDISLITKYIKEKGVEPLKWHVVEGNSLEKSEVGNSGIENLDVDVCIFAKNIKILKNDKKFVPKILAYDIETNNRKISFYPN